MAKTCAVVGGGFQGMIAAYLLSEKGFKVTLIEKAPVLGGIMYSWEWKGFAIDRGVHLFDSIPRNLADIVTDVMDGQVLPIHFNYGSVYNGVTTRGLAIPDLSNLDKNTRASMLFDLVEAVAQPERNNFSSLFDWLKYRYGLSAANILDATMNHIYRVSTKDVEQESYIQTAYHRLRFLTDEMALELKKHPALDARVAARRMAMGKVDDLVSMYPGAGGMKGFVDRMTKRLDKMGVRILTGSMAAKLELPSKGVVLVMGNGDRLEFDHLFWAQDYASLANIWTDDGAKYSRLMHATPMVLYYYTLDAKYVNDYTYFHQFTPGSLIFRSAAAGLYSNQIQSDGKTFISTECPVNIGDDMWEHPEKYTNAVFQECISMDLLKPGAVRDEDVKIVKAPVTHKFNKVGLAELGDEFDAKIEKTNLAIVKPTRKAFTRREIMWAIEASVAKMTQ